MGLQKGMTPNLRMKLAWRGGCSAALSLGLVLAACKPQGDRAATHHPPPTTSDTARAIVPRAEHSAAAETRPALSSLPPPAPADTGPEFVAHGACPFECCRYGQWQLANAVALRARPAVAAESLGALAVGDSVRADSGIVILRPTGLAVMAVADNPVLDSESLRFEAGDTVELLEEQGEGYRHVRWHGSELIANVDDWNEGSGRFRLLRRPFEAWWVYMTEPKSGRHGWVLMENVLALGSDACG